MNELWREYAEDAQHGMVIVPVGTGFVPTCLCGWWEPQTSGLDLARFEWIQHMNEI